jgi:thiamine-monophosphate kinase
MNELALIEKIARLTGRQSNLRLGIGDDCAIFSQPPGHDLLFTTDQMIEGVHFLKRSNPEVVGARALARSLSDIAAMGGIPQFCLVALAVPKSKADVWVERYYKGLLRIARKYKVSLAGGDLAQDDHVHCDVMVCGSIEKGQALRRSGARPGDVIYVSGKLGKPWDREIRPRLELGRKLVGKATACMDLSDGISLDLHRMCLASGASADLEKIPQASGASLERALHGGEDYELLFTLPAGVRPPRGAFRVGVIAQGDAGAVRLFGKPVSPRGYSHFSK